MAIITYTSFLAANDFLESYLSQSPAIGTADATTFEVIVPSGPFSGFVFRLTGTGFTYSGGIPSSGTITGFTVLDNTANVVATATAGTSGFSSSLDGFWNNLLSLSTTAAVVDELLGQSDNINGADSIDKLRAYSNFFPDTLSAGAGNDFLSVLGGGGDVLIGGPGDDTLTVFGAALQVHGSAQDGTGGETENDVLEIAGSTAIVAITDIDGLRFTNSAPFFVFSDQIGTGLLSPTLAVDTLTPGSANAIVISRGGSSAVNLDLSNWTFGADWFLGPNHITSISFDALMLDDHVIGTLARDEISGGDGNDTLDGFGGTDLVHGGNGDDRLISGVNAVFSTLNGDAGIDTAVIDRSNRTASYTFDLSGSGTFLDGSLASIERIEFRAGSGNDHLTGGALADVLIGNAGSDFIAGGGGSDDLQGGNGIDTLSGDAGNDALAGGAGNDNLDGGEGDDTLTGGAGVDTLDGGDNTDTAVFSGPRAAYTITPLGSTFQISGPDGLDFLTNVEFAQFDDVTIALTSGGPSNQPPTITSNGGGDNASVSIAENIAAVTTVVATDPDPGTTLTYSIVGGTDQLKFQIDGASGALSFVTPPDFEAPGDADHNNSYVVQVQASDGALADLQTITVTVTDAAPEARAKNDFNADGTSDVLLQHNNGLVSEWLINSGEIASNPIVGALAASWHFQDTGDLNGDGRADVLLRHDSGQVVVWQMNANKIASNTAIANVSNQYHVQGIGDFNGDNRGDVLWRHDSGQVVLWQMNGDQIASNTAIVNVSNQYHVQGIGDFNGDGRADVLWRHDSGQVVLWQMNGDQIVANTAIGNISTQYHIQDVGDFNGDGRADVLWRHDSGQVVLWQMNGDQIVANTAIANVSNQYHVQDVEDLNGDGRDDILWRHDSGQVVLWQMNGDQIVSNTAIAALPNELTIQVHHFDLV